jgi:hypothetical protein
MKTDRARRLAALAVGAVVLVTGTGCTGDDSKPASSEGRSALPTPAPRSAPLRTEVTHVAGRLPAPARKALAGTVGRTISAYVDAAFLTGDYPRSDFDGSFGTFSKGLAGRARKDAALLTNEPWGSSTRSVRAVRRTAYLSVLAPKGKVGGVTAAVDLVLVVDRGDKAERQRVRLKGRLLLGRDKAGHWQIFGYDLNRSDTPMRSAS